MHTYAASLPMYRKSTTAKYRIVSASTPTSTKPGGTIPRNMVGTNTTELATTNTTMCTAPNTVLLQITAPVCFPKKFSEVESELKVSWASRTTKIAARDKNQFRPDQIIPTRDANTKKVKKARPPLGSAFDETNPASIAAPNRAMMAARVSTRRRKFKPTSEGSVGLPSAPCQSDSFHCRSSRPWASV